MYTEITVRVRPEEAASDEILRHGAACALKIDVSRVKHVDIIRRSVEASQKTV